MNVGFHFGTINRMHETSDVSEIIYLLGVEGGLSNNFRNLRNLAHMYIASKAARH